MHYSAKRGLAITCRLSVRPSVSPSVCDVGGLWSHRLEFLENISRLVSVGCSHCADRNIVDLLQGEQLEIWAQSDSPPVVLSVGDIRSQIAAEWLQIAQWSQWRAYRNGTIRRYIYYDLPFPQNGGPICPMNTRMAISPQRVIRYTLCLILRYIGFSGSADRMALFRVISNPRWRPAAILENFEWPYLRKGSFYRLHVKILW